MIAAVLLLALASVPASREPGDTPLRWGERRLDLAKLPPELPESGREAIEAWHRWAGGLSYRLDLDPTARVLLITPAEHDQAPRLLALATGVVERFDRELPAPPVRLAAPDPVLAAKTDEPEPARDPEIPEDPEGEEDHPWSLAPPEPEQVTSAPPVVTTWGSHAKPLDSQTVVLFVLRDQDDYEALLGELAARFAFLATWAAEARKDAGFVVGDPLAAAYLLAPPGVEEWHPDHELLNRLARLCLLRRFGDLPNWLVQGYAWHHEIAHDGAVYCFPWRDEFVWAVEHTAWPATVRDRYQKEKLDPPVFLGWKRGKYESTAAQASWAMVEFLLAREKEKLPYLLDRLRVFREEHGRIQDDPTSWRRNTDYAIPVGDQEALFEEVLGKGWERRATVYVRRDLGAE